MKTSGILALCLVGGYYAYRNRNRIQNFFESKGVHVPQNVDELKGVARSSVSKLRAKTQLGGELEQKTG